MRQVILLPVLGTPEDLDFAVARGAAYYGWTKQSGGLRISAVVLPAAITLELNRRG